MRKFPGVLITVIVLSINCCLYAQTPDQPMPDFQIRDNEARRHPMPSPRQMEEGARVGARLPSEYIRPLTPKERKAIEVLKTPKTEDAAEYADLLKLKGTGIVRLLPGAACSSKYIARADLICTNILPNAGAHLFRKHGFTADLVFQNGALIADGFFSQSIITALGDIPLDQVSGSTSGMKFIMSHSPATDVAIAKKQYAEIVKGITSEGFTYKNRINPVPGTTYAIRVIAFRNGNNVRKRRAWFRANIPLWRYQNSHIIGKLVDDEVRTDLTIVFRVLRKDEEGGITFVWKELAKQDSPKITFPDGVRFADFK